MGISLDEYKRMKESDVQYITNRYPLIERRMTRDDCKSWLIDHGLEVPNKSACVFCPFQTISEWRELKQSGNGDWTTVIQTDDKIRGELPPVSLYIHQDRLPINQVDMRTQREKGQLSLWDEECSGLCGV
jgi:hypothetical protein